MGAVRVKLRRDEEPYAVRAVSDVEAKQRSGQATAGLIMAGETVVLDCGKSSAAHAVPVLPRSCA